MKRTTEGRSRAPVRFPGVVPTATALVLLCACCSVSSPPAVETVEVLGADSFRHDGCSLDFAGLRRDLGRRDGDSGIDRNPLRLVVPAEMPLARFLPVLEVVSERHGNLTLETAGGPGRTTTLPILCSHACNALWYLDGDYTYDEHELPILDKVGVCALWSGEGALVVDRLEYLTDENRELHEWVDAPTSIRSGAPPTGTAIDLEAVGAWFALLREAGVKPLLCFDYRTASSVGPLVDALRAAKAAVGHDVLLAPSPLEDQLEEVEPEEGGE